MTSSDNEEDVLKPFYHGTSSDIQKPVDFNQFVKTVERFHIYWHTMNKLPGLLLHEVETKDT